MNDVELAMNAARVAADVLLKYWQQLDRDDADLKGRNDWVSRADRESEQAIVAFLKEHAPDDHFLGEEGGTMGAASGGASAERTWIIDPLDGTSNYLQHFPVWSVSIGLRRRGEMTTGVVYEPLRDQMFAAETGSGAFLNGRRLAISSHPSLEGSFLATGFPFRAMEHIDVYTAIFHDVIAVSKGLRRAGSAALDLAYTAAGVFDGFFELHLAPWDVAAGSVLVREAGGVVSDFSGGERFWDRGNIVGAAPGVHADLLALISHHTAESRLDQ
jgi:myo-inositol-1(or 4)-monophosphatase